MIIKNGKLVTEKGILEKNLYIKDGKILKIDSHFDENLEDVVIDAKNNFILPGGVDVHTHFNLLSGESRAADDFFSGSLAAIHGGTTTIVDHIGFGPENCSLMHQINVYHEYAKNNCLTDYSFHGVVQHVNQKILDEFSELMRNGIPSFKVYMTYDDKLSDSELYQVLRKVNELGGIVAVHAENDDLINYFRETFINQGCTEPKYHALSRPNICESEAISRILKIAKLANDAPIYIVHLSTEEGLNEVIKARKEGQKNIFVETCPQYLFLDDSVYDDDLNGLKYIMAPPIRKKSDNKALWNGIKNKDIDVVATDHCPFYFDEKLLGKNNFTKCPNGGPGVEDRMLLMLDSVSKGIIDIETMVQITSTNPSKIYGLYPKKGTIQVGSDADLIILNNKNHIISKESSHSNVDYNLYEGKKVNFSIDKVIKDGEVLVENNKLINNNYRGSFIERKL